ncbi:aldose epimerase [Halobacillus sp. BBL2006]|nr:aldose epimerase [Halobacillus sp. BBL2006]
METKEILTQVEQTWTLYRLENDQGMSVNFLNYGGIITDISVPDNDGQIENVVLRFKNYEDYISNPVFFGALVGRVAGRIKEASFYLNGQTYQLGKNERSHHLHGGQEGFHSRVWNVTPYENEQEIGAKLSLSSPAGDGGYPGNVEVEVTYILTNDNRFIIDYKAETDEVTPLTLTNHAYFNLSGGAKRTIDNHVCLIDSTKIAELDEELIPTGEWLDVNNTPFDFQNKKELKNVFTNETTQQKVASGGMDHYFKFNGEKESAIHLEDPESGRTLDVTTDQPGVVIYTSNSLPEGIKLLEGEARRHVGICLETQSSPASLHEKGFPDVLLSPENPYHKRTVFSFGKRR